MNVSDLISEALDKEFEALFQEHYPMAYRTAYGVIGNSQDAGGCGADDFSEAASEEVSP